MVSLAGYFLGPLVGTHGSQTLSQGLALFSGLLEVEIVQSDGVLRSGHLTKGGHRTVFQPELPHCLHTEDTERTRDRDTVFQQTKDIIGDRLRVSHVL